MHGYTFVATWLHYDVSTSKPHGKYIGEEIEADYNVRLHLGAYAHRGSTHAPEELLYIVMHRHRQGPLLCVQGRTSTVD